MPWPWRKGLFDFDDEFNRIKREMEKMFEDAFKLPVKEGEIKRYGPYVYGFSMRIGPDGKPVVREFGNVGPKLKGLKEEREPLVDVIEEKDKITVIAELPGISRENIKLNCTGNNLSIKVDNPQRKYSKLIELPVKVKPNSAKASYKNGVLEVSLQRDEPKKEKRGHGIKID